MKNPFGKNDFNEASDFSSRHEEKLNLKLDEVPVGYEAVSFNDIIPGDHIQLWTPTITRSQTKAGEGGVISVGYAEDKEHKGLRYIKIEGWGTLYSDNTLIRIYRRI